MASNENTNHKDGNISGNNMKTKTLISLFDRQDGSWDNYEDARKFLDFINPVDGMFTIPHGEAEVMQKTLPFYKDISLIRISAIYEDDDFNLFFLKRGDDFIRLNGNAAYIHEANETGAISLSSENVFDYLKFFSAFVDSEDEQEAFYIIEGPESEFLKHVSEYDKKRALRQYGGPRLISDATQDSFAIETRLLFCGNLYDARFKITGDGTVVMTDDKHIGAL